MSEILSHSEEEPPIIEINPPVMEGEGAVEKIENEKSPIEHRRLNSLKKAFQILNRPEEVESEKGEVEKVRWLDLYKKIGDFESSTDLSDKIRETAVKWVKNKIPELKKNISAIANLPDEKLSSALVQNWFSELPEVEGQRRETLLAGMASVVKRIETRMWYKKLEQMDEKDLEKMGVKKSERDLLIELLKTGSKTNPLFVRFLAYSRLTPEASKKADLQKFEVPGKKGLFSLSQMFPKETGQLSNKFKKIHEKSEKEEWADEPGGDDMANFLGLMSEIYSENTTAEQAQKLQKEIEKASDKLIKSGFPIVIIPSTEGIYKERYIDPEIRICLRSKDCKEQDQKFEKAKDAMVKCLKKDNLNEFAESLENKHTESLMEIGEFGVNLVFKGVAQESKGTNIMFINEQRRSYDLNFSKYLDLIGNSNSAFSETTDEQKQEMARTCSMLHEFSHLHIENSDGSSRLGKEAEAIICEVEAESIYRAYLPEIIAQQGLDGTKEQWACAMLATSLQMLKDPESYANAAGFTLKSSIDKGAISWDGNKLKINDIEMLFKIQQESARQVLGLFEDTGMTDEKAKSWVNNNCRDKNIDEIIKFVEKQP